MNSKDVQIDSSEDRVVVQLDELGQLVRQKRLEESLTLEQAAKQSGVSAATLSRLERSRAARATGQEMPTPDVRTLGSITDWLQVAVVGAGFASAAAVNDLSTPDMVEAHLRADRNLDPSAAALLARVFRAAYSQFSPQDSNSVPESLVKGESNQ